MTDNKCTECNWRWVEICNNPDHWLMDALSCRWDEMKCPVCGWDEHCRTKYICEVCKWTWKKSEK